MGRGGEEVVYKQWIVSNCFELNLFIFFNDVHHKRGAFIPNLYGFEEKKMYIHMVVFLDID